MFLKYNVYWLTVAITIVSFLTHLIIEFYMGNFNLGNISAIMSNIFAGSLFALAMLYLEYKEKLKENVCNFLDEAQEIVDKMATIPYIYFSKEERDFVETYFSIFENNESFFNEQEFFINRTNELEMIEYKINMGKIKDCFKEYINKFKSTYLIYMDFQNISIDKFKKVSNGLEYNYFKITRKNLNIYKDLQSLYNDINKILKTIKDESFNYTANSCCFYYNFYDKDLCRKAELLLMELQKKINIHTIVTEEQDYVLYNNKAVIDMTFEIRRIRQAMKNNISNNRIGFEENYITLVNILNFKDKSITELTQYLREHNDISNIE